MSHPSLFSTGWQRIDLGGGGFVRWHEAWLADAEAAFAALQAETPWTQREIWVGRMVKEPRLTAFYADPGVAYTYSGTRLSTQVFTPRLAALREAVSAVAGVRFDSVLLNFYRSGQDSIGFHADDEPELGPDPVVGSLSLGAPRRFVVRPQRLEQPGLKRWEALLGEGTLLLMEGSLQRTHEHGVPKSTVPTGPRINLTFRRTVR